MKFIAKLFKAFLIPLVSLFLLNFVPLSIFKNSVQAESCSYTINYSNGTSSSGNQIALGQPFTLQATISGPSSQYDLRILAPINNSIQVKRFNMQGSTSISVTSQQIFGGNLPTVAGALMEATIVFQGTEAVACVPTRTFTFTNIAQNACTGNLVQQNTALTATAQNCQGKYAKFVYMFQNLNQATDRNASGNIDSQNWTRSISVPNQYLNWTDAYFYACDPPSDPNNPDSARNCQQIGHTGLQVQGTCPSFAAFNPSTPTSDQALQVQYIPLSGASASDYKVKVQDASGNINQFNLTDVSATFGRWVADLGQYSTDSRLQIFLVRQSDNFACDVQSVTISSGLFPGENPCHVERGIPVCNTALGNIPTDITSFAGKVLSVAIGIAGGIALILLVTGSIRVLTSSGDQQRLAGGRDTIIAAIAGLLFLIFSVLILKAIGLAIFGSGRVPFT